MRLHNLPDESITIADEHKVPELYKGKLLYTVTEDYFFDHNQTRCIVRFRYHTTATMRLQRNRSITAEVTRYIGYDEKRQAYKDSLGTAYIDIDPKEFSKLLTLYRTIRETYTEESKYPGTYYRKAA